jgi:hypothetical protein
MDLLEDYFTKEQLAEQLRVAPRSINRYMNTPDGIPHVLIGGRVMFKRASVVAWLEGRERRPNPRRRAA